MVMRIPRKRTDAPVIDSWYLTLYMRNHRRWLLVGAIGVGGYILIRSLATNGARLDHVALPWLLLVALSTVASLGWHIYKSKQALNRSDLSVRVMKTEDFEAYLRAVELPPSLMQAGYERVEGGRSKDLYRTHEYAGCSVTSKRVNRELRRRSQARDTLFEVRVPRRARLFGSFPGAAWVVDKLASVIGWHWTLTRLWPLPLLSRQVMPAVVKAMKNYAEGALTNERKIRLVGDLLPPSGEKWPVDVERTDYLSDLVTAHLTGIQVRDNEGHTLYDGLSLPYTFAGGKPSIKPLSESSCSNQLGVSGVVLCLSTLRGELRGHIYFVLQGKAGVASPGMLAPSGSGSLDWSDYSSAGGDAIAFGMWREMLEETYGGDWSEIVEREPLEAVLTGFGRMLHRGGKPEFYGLMVMRREEDEFGIHAKEKGLIEKLLIERVYPVTAARFTDVLRTFMRSPPPKQVLSHPLFMCLALLVDYLIEEPEHFEALVARVARGQSLGAGGAPQ